jgi:hypothetical protein
MVARMIGSPLLALALTIASAFVSLRTDERAMYGYEGPLEQNWLPRELGGWPAPYLADNPNTSVPHKLGPEDDFRPGPFIATYSFWLLVSFAMSIACPAALRRKCNRRLP